MSTLRPPILSRETRESGLVVIHLSGELDTAGTAQIEPAFVVALPDRTVSALVDMSGVPFLTSRALAMLVVRAQAMKKAGGKLCLAALSPIVADVFERAGFSSLFTIYPTVDAALAELERKKPRARKPRKTGRLDFS